MRCCENLDCSFLRESRKAARFDDGVALCTHCGKSLSASFVPETRGAPQAASKELRGVPLEALGTCNGSWVPVQAGAQIGKALGIVGAVVLALAGLGALGTGHPVGVVPLVIAVGGVIWLINANPAASVRMYERGFEFERGSQQVAIAFTKLQSATLVITEVKKVGVRVRWELRLDVVWDVGQLALLGEEPGRSEKPDGPFFEFAQQVVHAHARRAG